MVSRRKKNSLIVVVALVATLAAVALAAHVLVSRQDHEFIKRQLASRVLEVTGFELEINGPLELPYSLLPTVVFRDIVLNNPEFDGEEDLLQAEELRIKFAVLPLLRGEIRIYESSMSSMDLNLEVSEEGQSNWISGDIGGGVGLAAQFAIHEIKSDDIDLSYRNLQTGVEFNGRIDELHMRAPIFNGSIQLALLTELSGTPIEVSGSVGSKEDILSGNPFPLDVDIDIRDVDIEVAGQIDRIESGEISNFLLRLSAEGADLRELEKLFGLTAPETDSFSVKTVLAVQDGTLSASSMVADVAWLGSEMELSGNIGNIFDLTGFDITARISGADLSDFSSLADLAAIPRTDSYKLSGTIRGDWPSFEFSSAQIDLRREDITFSASGALSNVASLDSIDVLLDVQGADLSDLSQFLGQELPSTRTYQFSGRLEGSWPSISVSSAKAKLTRENVTIDLAGGIKDIADRSGISLDVVASGGNLAAVPELTDFEPPATDHFSIEGLISGSPPELAMTNMEAVAERGRHRLTLSGNVGDVAGFGGLDGHISAAGTDLSEFNSTLGLSFPPTDHYRLLAAVAGDAGTLSAREILIEGSAPGARLELRGSIGRVRDLREVDLAALTTMDSLAILNRYLRTGLPESAPIELRGRLNGSAPNLNLDEFTARSGNSLLMGSAGIRTGERLSIVGSVSSGVLDLQPYFVVAPEEAEARAEASRDRIFSDELFDFSYLDAFDVQFRLDNLELLSTPGNVLIEKASIKLQDGSLTVDSVELNRDDTSIGGHFALNRQTEPAFDAELSIENVDLETFLQDIRIRDIDEGTFDLALKLRSRGNSVREVMANLNGEIAAFVSEARVPDASLSLRSIDVILGMLPWLKRREDLVVNCAISQLDIDDGVVDVKLLYLDSAQMRMVGGGTVDLGAEQLDLRLAPRARGARILAHNIDLVVKGSLIDPRVSSVGAGKAIATNYGKYALLGPFGLLVPTGRSQKHPCVGSLQEYRERQALED